VTLRYIISERTRTPRPGRSTWLHCSQFHCWTRIRLQRPQPIGLHGPQA